MIPTHVRFFFGMMALIAAATAPRAASHYRAAHAFTVPGDGGWDFIAVDDSTGRIFATHGTQVQVIDEKTGKLEGAIPDTKGVHGVAFAREFDKGYVSNGKDTSVTVFNLKTLETLGKIKVTGINPDAILYDGISKKIFTFNGKSANATVIDVKTDKVTATIPLDGKPEVAAADGLGNLYVNIEDKSRVAVIDAKSLKVAGGWSLAPGASPSGLALDAASHRLFSVCENKWMIISDSKSMKVVDSLPIGDRVDGAAFDPAKHRAFSSNGEGSVTVAQDNGTGKYAVLETIATRKGARTIALDGKTHHLFLPTADFGPAPVASPDNPKPRPAILPGTFVILDLEPLD